MNKNEDLKMKKEVLFLCIPADLNTKLTKHVSKIGISKTAFICNLLYQEINEKTFKQNDFDEV